MNSSSHSVAGTPKFIILDTYLGQTALRRGLAQTVLIQFIMFFTDSIFKATSTIDH
jgi:hypothetical protein